jgi:hypothetical protein
MLVAVWKNALAAVCIVTFAITIAGPAHAGDLDGYKDLKFGTKLDEVRTKGFYCEPRATGGTCESSVFHGHSGETYVNDETTVFGAPVVGVVAEFNQSHLLRSVLVSVSANSCSDMMNATASMFGKGQQNSNGSISWAFSKSRLDLILSSAYCSVTFASMALAEAAPSHDF